MWGRSAEGWAHALPPTMGGPLLPEGDKQTQTSYRRLSQNLGKMSKAGEGVHDVPGEARMGATDVMKGGQRGTQGQVPWLQEGTRAGG